MTLSTGSKNTAHAPESAVRKEYTWEEVQSIVAECYRAGKSYRQIAAEQYNNHISHATIQRVHKGIEPQAPKIREVFGLPDYRQVVLVTPGRIPDGTQVIHARQCSCGQWYVPNHPRRQKCFICSPYRGQKGSNQ